VPLGAVQGLPPTSVVGVYESFAVVRVLPEAEPPDVELHPEWDQVMLNTGTIDVQSEQGRALDRFPPASRARQLLVHFAGPISPAMHEHLVATGARIVAYVPSNTYLVWADVAAQARVRELRDANVITWASDFLPQLRFDLSGREHVTMWDVQLVEDVVNGETLRSEERRVGKECRRLCRSRWSPYH
jgi:hypothetical protein